MFAKRNISLLILALATLTLVGCKEDIDTSAVLATVDGEPITEKAYDFFTARLRQPVHPDKAKAKELILKQLVTQQLLVNYALHNKIDEELDVYLALARQRNALLIGAAQRKILKEFPTITESQIKARYAKEVDATHKLAYKTSHIVLASEADAKAVIAELDKGKGFAGLAKSKSKGPTKDKGGDLGWVQQGMVVPAFFEAVTKLKKGSYTKTPVKTQFGWHVIKVNDSRKIKIPPYDKVKADVARLIQQDMLAKKVEELREKAKIDIKKVEAAKPEESSEAKG
ncbi:MAG: hypothetical protein GXP09_00375 [Gammaproteobacteria bacterium]|nr:hypothetical protein [Gammaproteobacteria bacterium]